MFARVIFLSLAVTAPISRSLAANSVCLPPSALESGAYVDLCDKAYRIKCGDDILTGFSAEVEGQVGIVTALHGVLSCEEITATNQNHSFAHLRLLKADVERDAAFLRGSDRVDAALRQGQFSSDGELRVVGYPQALSYQQGHRLERNERALAQLKELLPPDDLATFRRRASPSVDIKVLSLSGPLQRGDSGAPILAGDGTVIAIADGGLLEGTVGINWAIPLADVKWRNLESASANAAPLVPAEAHVLFDVAPHQTTLPALLMAAGFTRPGRIRSLQNGVLSDFFERPIQGNPYSGNQTLYSVAVGPNGDVYYADANAFYIFKVQPGQAERPIYAHTTYVRCVRFDAQGRLYFSQSTGAGGDGLIFRLDNGHATPFFPVRLAEVDGSWAGDFAFDSKGDLWLSSGNRSPASLYKVVGDHAHKVFTSSRPIMGMVFTPGGDLLYADWAHGIQRLQIPGFLASPAYANDQIQSTSDVALATFERFGYASPNVHVDSGALTNAALPPKAVAPPLHPIELPSLLLASSRDRPGRIRSLQNGVLADFFERPIQGNPYSGNQTLYSVAVGPDGGAYYADANAFYIFKVEPGQAERPIYAHNTYVRCVRFDARGRLYFSQAAGGGADGMIFRLDNGRATPFFPVRLAEVDGYWAGDFAFDLKGDLWLSSGNRVPASIYRVVGDHPQKTFTSPQSIMGMLFMPDGKLLYADGGHGLWEIETPGSGASAIYWNDQIQGLSDLALRNPTP